MGVSVCVCVGGAGGLGWVGAWGEVSLHVRHAKPYPPTHPPTLHPQIINFIYSVPQLFKFVPCPRHRLPRCARVCTIWGGRGVWTWLWLQWRQQFQEDGRRVCSSSFKELRVAWQSVQRSSPTQHGRQSTSAPPFRTSCLCRFDPQTGLLHATPNMNVVNLTLRLLGPCTEFHLCLRILVWQAACCALALMVRSTLAGWYK